MDAFFCFVFVVEYICINMTRNFRHYDKFMEHDGVDERLLLLLLLRVGRGQDRVEVMFTVVWRGNNIVYGRILIRARGCGRECGNFLSFYEVNEVIKMGIREDN